MGYRAHADFRGNGYAGECLDYAKTIAEKENCYKMMLLTGSKKPETFEINLDNFLQELEMGDIEFIVLAPSEVVNGITFLQVASNGYGYYKRI